MKPIVVENIKKELLLLNKIISLNDRKLFIIHNDNVGFLNDIVVSKCYRNLLRYFNSIADNLNKNKSKFEFLFRQENSLILEIDYIYSLERNNQFSFFYKKLTLNFIFQNESHSQTISFVIDDPVDIIRNN